MKTFAIPASFRIFKLLTLISASLMLSGCRDIKGPVWSPNGQLLAYTTFNRDSATGKLSPDLYIVNTDAAEPKPALIAKGANFPHWSPDGQKLFFLGKQNSKGFFTAFLRHRPFDNGTGFGTFESVVETKQSKYVDLQINVSGTRALLCTARDPASGKGRTIELMDLRNNTLNRMKQLGEVFSPTLSPDGRTLAYSKKEKKAGSRPYIVILELSSKKLQEFSVFPTEQHEEISASTYIIHAFSDNDRFLFYSPGGKAIWTVRLNGKLNRFSLPKGYSTPWLVSIQSDSTKAYVTLSKVRNGRLSYDVFELHLSQGKFNLLERDSPEIIGGHALDPTSIRKKEPRKAWLSSAGLALDLGGSTLYFPKTGEQYLAASKLHRASGQTELSMEALVAAREMRPAPSDSIALDREEALVLLALKKAEQAAELFVRTYLLNPIGPEGLNYIFQAGKGLPKSSDEKQSSILLQLERFSAAAPDNMLIKHIKEGLASRLKNDHEEAVSAYRQAKTVCENEILAGGVSFLEAMTAFETGEIRLAGEKWENAARSKGFPQADYAAGLSAISYALDIRKDSKQKADAVIKIGLGLDSALAMELKKLPSELRGKKFKQSRESNERRSLDRTLRTWVNIREFLVPQAYLNSREVLNSEQKIEIRKILAYPITLSELQLAGLPEGTKTLTRIIHPVTVPDFSPTGEHLSFLVKGEVFPLKDQFCSLYVINKDGALVNGNPSELTALKVVSRKVISKATWAGPGEIQVEGSQIDVFGNRTAYQKSIPVNTP